MFGPVMRAGPSPTGSTPIRAGKGLAGTILRLRRKGLRLAILASIAAPLAACDALTTKSILPTPKRVKKGVSGIDPPLPKLAAGGGVNHATAYGWSKDGKEFGYCLVSACAARTTCEFVKRDGTRVEYAFGDADADAAEKRSQVEQRLQKRDYQLHAVREPDYYAWAVGLDLTWEPVGAATVRAGARVPGESIKVFGVEATVAPAKPGSLKVHPEALAIAPDADGLGLLLHGSTGDCADSFAVSVADFTTLASETYLRTGNDYHARKQYLDSANLFRNAVAADPKSAESYYNLAAAAALTDNPAAREILTWAVSSVDASLKDRAVSDPQFAKVRDKEWFIQLTK